MIDFRELVKAGIHFGHQTSRWSPKMAPYIWGKKNNAHLIDISKTAYCLDQAAQFLQETAQEGTTILWVGTKKAAQDAIKNVSQELDCPYVSHRWIGGTLSNFSQVKKSVTKMLHLEDVIQKSDEYSYYTKKEFNQFKKQIDRLGKNVGGLRSMTWPVGAVVLVDIVKEQSALKEAVVMDIPVVAMVDTNADPSHVNYVIPANDDAPRSINLVIDYLGKAVAEGKKKAAEKAKHLKEQKEQEAAAKKEAEPKKNTPTKTTTASKSVAKKPATQSESTAKSETVAKPVPKASAKKATTTKKKEAITGEETSKNATKKSDA